MEFLLFKIDFDP